MDPCRHGSLIRQRAYASPARAGMDLSSYGTDPPTAPRCFPRTGGDGPNTLVSRFCAEIFGFPRTGGDGPKSNAPVAADISFPRTGGDGPLYTGAWQH